MGYVVSVVTKEAGEFLPWWTNFTELSPDVSLDAVLCEYNCKNIPLGWDIEFDTEEDFVIFKLKFS